LAVNRLIDHASQNPFRPFALPERSPSTNAHEQHQPSGQALLDHLVRAQRQRLRNVPTLSEWMLALLALSLLLIGAGMLRLRRR
jgi:hypothetical protein